MALDGPSCRRKCAQEGRASAAQPKPGLPCCKGAHHSSNNPTVTAFCCTGGPAAGDRVRARHPHAAVCSVPHCVRVSYLGPVQRLHGTRSQTGAQSLHVESVALYCAVLHATHIANLRYWAAQQQAGSCWWQGADRTALSSRCSADAQAATGLSKAPCARDAVRSACHRRARGRACHAQLRGTVSRGPCPPATCASSALAFPEGGALRTVRAAAGGRR